MLHKRQNAYNDYNQISLIEFTFYHLQIFKRLKRRAFCYLCFVFTQSGLYCKADYSVELLWHGIFMALYIDYDTQEEFYPQFEGNVSKMLEIFAAHEHFKF